MKVIILWSIVFILFIFCKLFKRRISILSCLFLTFGITFFALFTPNGKVLIEFGRLHITLGAIQDGLLKSGILLVLQFTSKMFITSKIKIPGKIGSFITEVFLVYEKLTQGKKIKTSVKINSPCKKNQLIKLFTQIDQHLINVWQDYVKIN